MLAGDFRQSGNSPPFTLRKSGAAQVDPPRASTAVTPEFEGESQGEFLVNENKLNATVQLTNNSGAPAAAQFRVVGKRDTRLPVDRVTQDGKWLTITASEFRIVFEGQLLPGGEISGTFKQGPLESPLVSRRAPARPQ